MKRDVKREGVTLTTLLGSVSDGRELTYDASLYEFSLDDEPASLADIRTLDARNWVRWRAPQLRDWFLAIVPRDLAACNQRARALVRASGPDAPRHTRLYPENESQDSPVTHPATHPEGSGAIKARLPRMQMDSQVAQDATAKTVSRILQPDFMQAGSQPVQIASQSVQTIVREIVRYRTYVSKSYKTKQGFLAKAKQFRLESRQVSAVLFAKASGSPQIRVSPDGVVTVEQGTLAGDYEALISVVADGGAREDVSEDISIAVTIR